MSLLRRLTSAALLALASLGCASLRPPLTGPAQGGAPWTEVTSSHFVLRTDAVPREARELISQFEGLHSALAFVLQRPTTSSAKIELVRFERQKDLVEVAQLGPAERAYFLSRLPGDLETRSALVFHGEELADVARRPEIPLSLQPISSPLIRAHASASERVPARPSMCQRIRARASASEHVPAHPSACQRIRGRASAFDAELAPTKSSPRARRQPRLSDAEPAPPILYARWSDAEPAHPMANRLARRRAAYGDFLHVLVRRRSCTSEAEPAHPTATRPHRPPSPHIRRRARTSSGNPGTSDADLAHPTATRHA